MTIVTNTPPCPWCGVVQAASASAWIPGLGKFPAFDILSSRFLSFGILVTLVLLSLERLQLPLPGAPISHLWDAMFEA